MAWLIAAEVRRDLLRDGHTAEVFPLRATHTHELIGSFWAKRIQQYLGVLQLRGRLGGAARVPPNTAVLTLRFVPVMGIARNRLAWIEIARDSVHTRRYDCAEGEVWIGRSIDCLYLDVGGRLDATPE